MPSRPWGLDMPLALPRSSATDSWPSESVGIELVELPRFFNTFQKTLSDGFKLLKNDCLALCKSEVTLLRILR